MLIRYSPAVGWLAQGVGVGVEHGLCPTDCHWPSRFDKINVNAIAPGVVDTPMWDHVDRLFAALEHRPIGEKKRLVGEAVPYGRMGTPDDIAGAAVFLASADADYIVAQTLNVDGGNWMS